ncbi:MAG: glucan biosynthesis protein [Hyphomicrobiaceae bacterium]
MLTRRQFTTAVVSSAGLALVPGVGWPGVGWPGGGEALARDGLSLGEPVAFTFEGLIERARVLAQSAYAPSPVANGEILEAIDYDAAQKIKYNRERTLWGKGGAAFPVQFFHLGRYAKEPVRVHVLESGLAREVVYRPDLFETPADHPARKLPAGAGFAGFRVMYPDIKGDWLAFLGASYFRSGGPFDQYGLSARGLAIDTGLATPEEFPRFGEFWLVPEPRSSRRTTVHALLESKSVTGAYTIVTERKRQASGRDHIVMEIDAHLFARADVQRLGIAAFSSMFWYGETTRRQGADWRPEIHDSDGLAIWTGKGERIWRPLANPRRVTTNAFLDENIRGFGLLQRDRLFAHYLDDGVFYEKRPSVWVEPLDPWGKGAVHLVEIPTDDEIHDNIAAYWNPEVPLRKGDRRRFRYRLTWLDEIAFPKELGRNIGTWTGVGGRPGQPRPKGVRKFVLDFEGEAFKGLTWADGVEIVATASRGAIAHSYAHPVARHEGRFRAVFDVNVTGTEPVDIRVFLRHKGRALTETWLYQYHPEG